MGGALLLRQPSEQNAELHTTSVHYVGSDGRKMVGLVFHPPEAAVPPVYALRTFERVPECEGASAGGLMVDRLGKAHSGLTPRWARVGE